jgi:hypothetical protein
MGAWGVWLGGTKMTIGVEILIAIVGVSIAVAAFFFGRHDAARKSGQTEGTIAADISYINETVKDIKVDVGAQRKEINDILGRLGAAEGSIVTINRRIDTLVDKTLTSKTKKDT